LSPKGCLTTILDNFFSSAALNAKYKFFANSSTLVGAIRRITSGGVANSSSAMKPLLKGEKRIHRPQTKLESNLSICVY
jgi:hypothetical protein